MFTKNFGKWKLNTVRAPLLASACIFFIPCFSAVYNQDRLILETIYVVNKEILQKNPRFIIKSGFKSRVDYNGACTVALVFIEYASWNCIDKRNLLIASFKQWRQDHRTTLNVFPWKVTKCQNYLDTIKKREENKTEKSVSA